MQKIIAILLLSFSFSCGNKRLVTYTEVRKYYGDYVVNHNKSSLKKSYKTLLNNEDFGITGKNADLVIPIYNELRKYDELIKLLNVSTTFSDYQKTTLSNTIKARKYKCKDTGMLEAVVSDNLKIIQEEISTNPEDSILYVDFYLSKLFIRDLNSLLEEIDSLKKVDNRFSDNFYEYILKDAVKELDDQIEKCE